MVNSQPGGYRTYTTNLVNALQQADVVNSYQLLTDRLMAMAATAGWQLKVLSRAGSLGFIWREQASLPRYFTGQKADVLHCPGATAPLRPEVPLALTIFDTIEFTEPMPSLLQARLWAMRLYSRAIQARAVQIAARIITVSEYSKQQIVQRFGVPVHNVTVTHLAPSSCFRPPENGSAKDAVQAAFGISGYVLAFTSAARRKNLNTLLKAYAALPSTVLHRHPLLLICTHDYMRPDIKKRLKSLRPDYRVMVLTNVSDERLVQLYHAADVFVFPSLEEGFGLPPLEAMASGTPVIASDTSAMPEVLGSAAMFVSPTDEKSLTEAIGSVLENPGLATSLRQKGLARSRQFSWDKTARETLRVYESVARL